MKQPTKKAWCFGATYKVVTTKVHEVLAGAIMGGKTKVIYINETDSKKEQIHTAIHELVHGMSRETSLNQAISPDLEEILANNTATLIMKNFDVRWKS